MKSQVIAATSGALLFIIHQFITNFPLLYIIMFKKKNLITFYHESIENFIEREKINRQDITFAAPHYNKFSLFYFLIQISISSLSTLAIYMVFIESNMKHFLPLTILMTSSLLYMRYQYSEMHQFLVVTSKKVHIFDTFNVLKRIDISTSDITKVVNANSVWRTFVEIHTARGKIKIACEFPDSAEVCKNISKYQKCNNV
ncbi:hypothetical protein EKK70_03280 [Desulfovibrio sp. DS-1]|nr:hypothetical protein EKK70_03280 [Desulfovibrio sp. DS-1]